MSHEFETGFSVAQAMWHRHPNSVVLDAPPTLEDALDQSGLNWNVDMVPLFAKVGDDYVEVPDRRATVRDSDNVVLGDVSAKYKVSQNKDTMEGFRPLIDEGILVPETAGSLRTGRRCWMLCRYLDDAEVTPGDKIAPYILVAWGHDGKMAVRIINTPIRVVCMNTMRASGAKDGDLEESFKDANNITIAHSGNVNQKVKTAIRAVTVARAEFKNTIDVYRAMAGKPVDVQTVKNFARELFDSDYTQASELVKKLRAREKEDEVVQSVEFQRKIEELEILINSRDIKPTATERSIVESFESGPGHEMAGSTVWGLVNACTDFIDHKRNKNQDAAMASSWFGKGAKDREKVFTMAEALL